MMMIMVMSDSDDDYFVLLKSPSVTLCVESSPKWLRSSI